MFDLNFELNELAAKLAKSLGVEDNPLAINEIKWTLVDASNAGRRAYKEHLEHDAEQLDRQERRERTARAHFLGIRLG